MQKCNSHASEPKLYYKLNQKAPLPANQSLYLQYLWGFWVLKCGHFQSRTHNRSYGNLNKASKKTRSHTKQPWYPTKQTLWALFRAHTCKCFSQSPSKLWLSKLLNTNVASITSQIGSGLIDKQENDTLVTTIFNTYCPLKVVHSTREKTALIIHNDAR